MFDGKTFGEEIVSTIKFYLDKQLAEINNRLDQVNKRFDDLPAWPDLTETRKAFEEDLLPVKSLVQAVPTEVMIKGWIGEALASLPPIPELPKEVLEVPELLKQIEEEVPEIEDFRPMIVEEVTKFTETLKSAEEVIKGWINDSIAALPPPPPEPKPVELPDFQSIIIEEVTKAVSATVSAIPPAEPGKSVTVEDVRPLITDEVANAIKAIPIPKDGNDGVNLAGAMIDRNGELVLTLSNGVHKNLGLIVGKDGEPGKNGIGLSDIVIKDGELVVTFSDETKKNLGRIMGKDGVDGIGFDDMSAEVREDGLYLVWTKGDVIKEALLPSIIYRDTWKEGKDYRMGDAVTWGGSLFIAKKDKPDGKPETINGDWKLAVKRGRDGREIVKVNTGSK